ncbi:MAG: hypothetical protein ABIL09_07155 [Gemmatimonadota bacterium]
MGRRPDLAAPLPAFVLIFLLSFVVRGAVLVSGLLPEEYFRPRGEIGRVAVSLASGGGYADPYLIPSGPTAHPTPLYTGLLGLVYALLGVTRAAAHVRALVAITSFSALNAMLPWLGGRLGLGRKAGLLAGFAAALIPQQGIGEVIGGGDQPFPAIALSLLAVAFLRRWSRVGNSVGGSVILGVVCGAALHLSPPLVLVFLGWMIFELIWSRDRRKYLLVGGLTLGGLLGCAPWAWRNHAAFHQGMFIRSNLGLELRLANHDGADANLEVTAAREKTLRHPSQDLVEAQMVRELGEAEYMRQARREALAWIRNHPAETVRLTLLRLVHFWCGPLRLPAKALAITLVTILATMGLRSLLPTLTAPQRAALLIPLATFPLIYYAVSYVPHYRAPLEWLLLLLASRGVLRAGS